MKIRLARLLVVAALAAAGGYAIRDRLISLLLFGSQEPPAAERGMSLARLRPQDYAVVATDLEVPWELVFLPDRSMLVTERPGRLAHFAAGGRKSYPIAGVRHVGEGGLLGLALHPRFADNHWLYLYLTGDGGSGLENRVERYRFLEGRLTDRIVVLAGIPAERFHDGGRIAFGPDGYLYITTGDATDGANAQDRASLGGKILRVTEDGRPAPDNPFGTAVYSYGHRNPQGLAWDDRGRLWSTEHGRSGTGSGYDELNLVEKGANYGWPLYQGDSAELGTVRPVMHSGPSYTWAPAGAAYWDGSVFFGGLRGEALYQARLTTGDPIKLAVHFRGELGRIRVVRVGPDGMLYLGTSNRDGRGRVRGGDDRVVRVNPEALGR